MSSERMSRVEIRDRLCRAWGLLRPMMDHCLADGLEDDDQYIYSLNDALREIECMVDRQAKVSGAVPVGLYYQTFVKE